MDERQRYLLCGSVRGVDYTAGGLERTCSILLALPTGWWSKLVCVFFPRRLDALNHVHVDWPREVGSGLSCEWIGASLVVPLLFLFRVFRLGLPAAACVFLFFEKGERGVWILLALSCRYKKSSCRSHARVPIIARHHATGGPLTPSPLTKVHRPSGR